MLQTTVHVQGFPFSAGVRRLIGVTLPHRTNHSVQGNSRKHTSNIKFERRGYNSIQSQILVQRCRESARYPQLGSGQMFRSRCLSISSVYRDAPEDRTYFQGDGSKASPTQRSGDSTNAPVFVLPNASPEDSGPYRLLNRVRFYWFMIGALSFPVLLFVVGPIWIPLADRVMGRSTVIPSLRSFFPGPPVELEHKSEQKEGVTSEYAEDDGTEISRVAATQSQGSPSPEVLALEKDLVMQKLWSLREQIEIAEGLKETKSLLDTANAHQLRSHILLVELITGWFSDRAILDNALLESRPIILPDESRVDEDRASLIRVLDNQGKNRIIILGLDLDWHESNQEMSSRFPSDRYELDNWLMDLANELERKGENASNLAVYLYTNRAIVDVDHSNASSWMTRYRQAEFPPGFPLAQLKKIKRVSDPNANVSNTVHNVSKTTTGKDAS